MLPTITWSIWTICNKITFENYKMTSPEVIVYTIASFMGCWEGLYDEGDAVKIREGAKKMMEKTAEVARGVQDDDAGTSGRLMVGSGS